MPKLPYSYATGVNLARFIFGSVGATIEGRENIPTEGSVLLVSNHQSYLDPLFVSLGCHRHVHYMAKEELFRAGLSRHMLLGLGAFPVDRRGPTKKTLAHFLKLLRNDGCVCLFAEGTRSKDQKLNPFQPGFARLAMKTNATIVPVALQGSRNLFENLQGPSLPIWRSVINNPPPFIKFGEPVPLSLSSDDIVALTHQRVRELLEECPQTDANSSAT